VSGGSRRQQCAADCPPKCCRAGIRVDRLECSPRRGVIAIGRSSPPHRLCIVLPAPGGLCKGMFCARVNEEKKIPAKSARTGSPTAITACTPTVEIWSSDGKREEMPDALTSPLPHRGSRAVIARLTAPSAAAARPRPEQATRQRGCRAVDVMLPLPVPAVGAAIAAVSTYSTTPLPGLPLMLSWSHAQLRKNHPARR
jgi:hypothetical protein